MFLTNEFQLLVKTGFLKGSAGGNICLATNPTPGNRHGELISPVKKRVDQRLCLQFIITGYLEEAIEEDHNHLLTFKFHSEVDEGTKSFILRWKTMKHVGLNILSLLASSFPDQCIKSTKELVFYATKVLKNKLRTPEYR